MNFVFSKRKSRSQKKKKKSRSQHKQVWSAGPSLSDVLHWGGTSQPHPCLMLWLTSGHGLHLPTRPPPSSNSPNTSYHTLAPRTVPGGWRTPPHTNPKAVSVKASPSACELLSSTGRWNLFSKLWKIYKVYFYPSWLTFTFKYRISRLR